MSDEEQHVWEKQAALGESTRWYSRFLLYRDMGTNRTLLGAANKEQVQKSSKPFNGTPSAWHDAYEQWQWKERATAFDEHKRKEQEDKLAALDALEQAAKEQILRTELAMMHRRVEALNAMAKTLDTSMRDPQTKEYEPKWIDPEKIREWRGCLDDIAKELGERAKVSKAEVTGANGGPIETESTQTIFYLPKVIQEADVQEDDEQAGNDA